MHLVAIKCPASFLSFFVTKLKLAMNDLIVDILVGLGGCSLLHMGTFLGSSEGDV
jgi:hypothetical protein